MTSSRITAGDVVGTIALFLIFFLGAFFACLLDSDEAAAHPLHAATSGDDVIALLAVFGFGTLFGLVVGLSAIGKARAPMDRGEKPTTPRPPITRIAKSAAIGAESRLLPYDGANHSYRGFQRDDVGRIGLGLLAGAFEAARIQRHVEQKIAAGMSRAGGDR